MAGFVGFIVHSAHIQFPWPGPQSFGTLRRTLPLLIATLRVGCSGGRCGMWGQMGGARQLMGVRWCGVRWCGRHLAHRTGLCHAVFGVSILRPDWFA